MTYDLYLWKRRADTVVSRGLAFLCVADGVPCDGLACLPRESVVQHVCGRFGPEPPFEFETTDVVVFVGLGHSAAHTLVPWFEALANELSMELYNPQVESPTEADSRVFDAMLIESQATATSDDLKLWLQGARAGDLVSMNELGNCYTEGQGVVADPEAAFWWYQRAAAGGHLAALLNVAESYRCGDGVPKDTSAAARAYQKAYERDKCVAAFALGEMYRDGEGVEPSLDRAEEYFTVARANRHPEGYVALKAIGRTPRD